MFFRRLAEGEDVIQIDDHILVQMFAEQAVHDLLECARSIGQAEAHDFELIVTKRCSESCLGYVFLSDADLMIALSKVKGREHSSTIHLRKKVVNSRKR